MLSVLVAASLVCQSFTNGNGLSDNTVNALLCDRQGIIWAGTNGGLNRYDGFRFESIPFPEGSDKVVHSIIEDKRGDLWILTPTSLLRYDFNASEIFPVKIREDKWNRKIVSICQASDGAIIIPLKDKGAARIIGNQVSEYVSRPVNAVTASSDGYIYFVTPGDSLFRANPDFSDERYLFPDGNPCAGKTIERLYCYDGSLFAGSRDGSLIIDLADRSARQAGCRMIWGMLKRKGSEELLASTSLGIMIVRRDSLAKLMDEMPAVKIPTSGVKSGRTNDHTTLSITEDMNGGLWVGHYYLGLSHFVPNRAKINLLSTDNINPTAFQEDDKGRIWFGTKRRGIGLIENGVLSMTQLGKGSKNATCLRNNGARNEIIYSSTQGVFAIDTDKKEQRKISDSNDANLYFLDSRGWLWIGDGTRDDISVKRGDSLVFMCTTNAKSIVEDKQGIIWLSSPRQGLRRFDGEEFHRYNTYLGNSDSDRANELYLTSSGEILVCTNGDGLLKYNPETDSFRRISDLDFLLGAEIYNINETQDGKLWVSTSAGLLSYSRDGNACKWHLSTEIHTYLKSSIASDGTMYTGLVSGGILSFRPDLLQQKEQEKPLIFSRIKIRSSKHNREPFTPEDGMTLRALRSSFSVFLADPSYEYPRAERIVYKMEGIDGSDWEDVENGRIDFYDLSPGRYTLKVRRESEMEAGKESCLPIRIQMPLALSGGAICLYVLLLVFLAVVISGMARKKAEQKAREKAIIQESEDEKNLYASKINFLTSIAHEIRTPLSLIKLPVESLFDRLGKSADHRTREDFDVVLRNTERLSSLLDELLDIQRLDKNSYTVHLSEINPSETARKVFGRFEISARRKNLRFDVAIQNQLPVCALDESLLDKILSNLCSNAIKYSKTYVSIGMEEKDNDIVVFFENDGPVVAVEMRDKIFKPFVRYEGTSAMVSGTGLGLSTSRSFAELLGGKLYMDQDRTVNRFILELPVSHIQETAEQTGAYVLPDVSRGKSRILVVEDEDDMREFLVRQFESNHIVAEAKDGVEALDRINSGWNPDLVVSDVMMPNMDGGELCRRIKGDIRTAHIPVLLLTARNGAESRVQGLSDGADAYIQKPFVMDDLSQLVLSTIVNRRRIRDHFSTFPEITASSSYATTEDDWLLRIQEYISKNIQKTDIRTEDLAQAACLSPATLARRMKEKTGYSTSEYLLLTRLKRAEALLLSANIPISLIYYEVGFSSHSYFTQAFRRKYGCSPKEYREKKN